MSGVLLFPDVQLIKIYQTTEHRPPGYEIAITFHAHDVSVQLLTELELQEIVITMYTPTRNALSQSLVPGSSPGGDRSPWCIP